MKERINIINKIPKEIKTVNKLLKKEKMEPLIIGDEVLEKCYLFKEHILQLSNMQSLCNLSFIFNVKAFARKENLSLKSKEFALAIGYPVDVAPFVYQQYDACVHKNGLKEKYNLMLNALKIFDTNRLEAEKIKGKNRNIHDKAHLAIQLKDLYEEYSQVNLQMITPFSLHYQALNKACTKIGFMTDNPLIEAFTLTESHKIPFGPWLILNKKKRDCNIIYGKNQQQLITYLLMSDYLKNNQLQYFFDLDLIYGWDKVLETQLLLGQYICPSLREDLTRFHQNPICQKTLIDKALALEVEITKKMEKIEEIKSETLKELEKVKVEFSNDQIQIEKYKKEINDEIEKNKEIKAEISKEVERNESLKIETVNELEKLETNKALILKEQERFEEIKAQAMKENENAQLVKSELAHEIAFFEAVKTMSLQEKNEADNKIASLEQNLKTCLKINKKSKWATFNEIIEKTSPHEISEIAWQSYVDYIENQLKLQLKGENADIDSVAISASINYLINLSKNFEFLKNWISQKQSLIDEFQNFLKAKSSEEHSTISSVILILKKLFKSQNSMAEFN